MTATVDAFETPTGVLVGHWEPGSAEWHAARADALGSSEHAAVLGLSPWDSHFSLWHRKAGHVGDVPETEEMSWGKKLEHVICDEFASLHPELRVAVAGTYCHRDRPWQLANPDRLARHIETGEVVVVEAKTDRFDYGWGPEGSDVIPLHYRVQVMVQLDVLGLRTAYVPVLFSGQDYREYVVTYDPADAKTIRDAGEAFVTSLREGRAPELDGHSSTYQALRELHPDIEDVDVEISAELANAYIDAINNCKAADEAKSLAAGRILDALGTGRRAQLMGQTIAYRVPGRGEAPPFLRPAQGLTHTPGGTPS